MVDYTSKIKVICDSLASIDVNVEEGEMVQICLRGLASKFGAFRTAVCTRENTPSFFDLQSMLLIEENHADASTSTHADSNSGPSGNRGSRGDENRQGKSATECWYYGKKGHRESECWKKRTDSDKSGSGKADRENRQVNEKMPVGG